VLVSSDLVGAVLTISDATRNQVPVRIEAVRPDPKDSSGETMLYEYMVQHPLTGVWQNPCATECRRARDGLPAERHLDPDGRTPASQDAG
jgi:hypothetical protein